MSKCIKYNTTNDTVYISFNDGSTWHEMKQLGKNMKALLYAALKHKGWLEYDYGVATERLAIDSLARKEFIEIHHTHKYRLHPIYTEDYIES